MDISSWTSEGMDWSSADSVRQMPLLPCFEAVRRACAERLLAVMNASLMASNSSSPATLGSQDVYGGLFGDSFDIEAMPISIFCSYFQSAMDMLLDSKFIDSSCLNSPSFESPTEITAAKIEASQSLSGQSLASLPKITQSRALTLTGAESRLPADPLSPAAEWLYQQYLLLNLFDSALIQAPQSIGPGSQRYFVEISPWDSENGSYYNLAIGWAGLTNFVVSDFAAQGWDYIVSTSGGRADAFGATDILDGWTRSQAWREWSRWTFNFGLLKTAGVDFELKAWQALTEKSSGINEAIPTIANEFSTEIFARDGYCAMAPSSQPDGNGLFELEIGNSTSVPEIPSAPGSGSSVKGWSLKSPGPFVAQFAFKFKD